MEPRSCLARRLARRQAKAVAVLLHLLAKEPTSLRGHQDLPADPFGTHRVLARDDDRALAHDHDPDHATDTAASADAEASADTEASSADEEEDTATSFVDEAVSVAASADTTAGTAHEAVGDTKEGTDTKAVVHR